MRNTPHVANVKTSPFVYQQNIVFFVEKLPKYFIPVVGMYLAVVAVYTVGKSRGIKNERKGNRTPDV